MKSKKIVLGKVLEIRSNYVLVEYNNRTFKCYRASVSDYYTKLNVYFKVGQTYKFLLKDNAYLSYKELRPKLIKNKKRPIPTISGSKNLEKYLKESLKHVV